MMMLSDNNNNSKDDVFVFPDQKGIAHLCEIHLSIGTVILMASAQSIVSAYSAVITQTAEMNANESRRTLSHSGLVEYLNQHATEFNNVGVSHDNNNICNSSIKILLNANIINESTSKIRISSGYITSLHAMLLPGSANTAIGVCCTNTGHICVFHLNGVHLSKIRETTLHELCWVHSLLHFTYNGKVEEHVLEQHIVDAQLSVDPLGNLECVAIATAHHVWCADIQLLLESDTMHVKGSSNDKKNKQQHHEQQMHLREELEEEEEEEQKRGNNCIQENIQHDLMHCSKQNDLINNNKIALSAFTNSNDNKSTQMFNKGVNSIAEMTQHYNNPLHIHFSHSHVVKLLVPQHHRVAFSLSVAFLVILQNGEIHTVQRILRGGSLELLWQYHNAQLHPLTKQNFESSYTHDEQFGPVRINNTENDPLWRLRYLKHSFDIPLVVYKYEHSPVVHQITETGVMRSSSSALESNRVCNFDSMTHNIINSVNGLLMINDAMLKYDEECNEMNLIVAGVLLSCTQTTHTSSLPCAEYNSNNNKNNIINNDTPLSALSLCAAPSAMCTRKGWCALITNIVPEHDDASYHNNNKSESAMCMYTTTLLHPPTRTIHGNNTHHDNIRPILFSVPDATLTNIIDVQNEARLLLINGNKVYLCDLQELRESVSINSNREQYIKASNTQPYYAQEQLHEKEFMTSGVHAGAIGKRSLESPLRNIWQGHFMVTDIALLSNLPHAAKEAKFTNQHASMKLLCATADILRVIPFK